MKNVLLVFLFVFPLIASAQSVAINNDASTPHNSSILDLKSTNKGLLMPRMTSAERAAISSPAVGLTVFDITTLSYWVYRGAFNGGWSEMVSSVQIYWEASGHNIYNTNVGNVGIGTSTTGYKLTINGNDPAIGLLNGGVAKGYIQADGSHLKIGTDAANLTGDIVFQPKGVDKVWIDQTGKMGIGTATPASYLTINGTNPSVQLQHNSSSTGYMQAVGNYLKLGTYSTNTTGKLMLQTKQLDRLTIDDDGLVGIGTTSPSSILTINDDDPIVQLRNNYVDKGFIQLVNDDIKIGTNISNPDGKFIVRTNGADRFTVDDGGNATLGTNSNGGTLVLNGPYTGMVAKIGGVTRLSSLAVGASAEITASNANVFRIRNTVDAISILPTGKMSMGTGGNYASGYVVSVTGKLIATELTAQAIGSWPDYVFADNYNLRPLSEVKNFIKENKHLPNIPSAAVIEKEGVQLGDMSKRLIEKVEELTLYLLQQQEQIDNLKKQLDEQSPK